MKISIIVIIAISLIGFFACNSSKTKNSKSENAESERDVLKTVDEAVTYVKNNFDSQEETLWIANSLNDEMGMNMAIIGVTLLESGYMPDGFEQKKDYRIYRYKKQ